MKSLKARVNSSVIDVNSTLLEERIAKLEAAEAKIKAFECDESYRLSIAREREDAISSDKKRKLNSEILELQSSGLSIPSS